MAEDVGRERARVWPPGRGRGPLHPPRPPRERTRAPARARPLAKPSPFAIESQPVYRAPAPALTSPGLGPSAGPGGVPGAPQRCPSPIMSPPLLLCLLRPIGVSVSVSDGLSLSLSASLSRSPRCSPLAAGPCARAVPGGASRGRPRAPALNCGAGEILLRGERRGAQPLTCGALSTPSQQRCRRRRSVKGSGMSLRGTELEVGKCSILFHFGRLCCFCP
jgi:hypothetical protein